jgi:hypothetical protein
MNQIFKEKGTGENYETLPLKPTQNQT